MGHRAPEERQRDPGGKAALGLPLTSCPRGLHALVLRAALEGLSWARRARPPANQGREGKIPSFSMIGFRVSTWNAHREEGFGVRQGLGKAYPPL